MKPPPPPPPPLSFSPTTESERAHWFLQQCTCACLRHHHAITTHTPDGGQCSRCASCHVFSLRPKPQTRRVSR